MESDAVRVAREYREQLARNEDAALKRMSRYWMKMEKSLEPQFFALSQEIKDLQDNGQPVSPQLIYTRQRYLDMMAQIMKELPDYEKYAIDLITDYQVENFNLGLDDASAVIRATMPSDPVWNQVGKDAVETMAGFAGNGAPLADLMRHDYGDLSVKVTDALVQGIGLGKGAHAVAKDMRDAMGMEFNRSVRIARTEINRAYRIANAEQYAKSGVVTKVLRLCYAPTACLACLELDGEECPKGMCDDHPNGKCTTVAVTIGGHYPQWQHGHDWLMEQSEEDQRRIIGDGRYELWKQNGIPLRDMVEMKPNAVWGGSPTIISEKVLREKYNITGGNKMLFDVKPAPAPEPPKDDKFDRSAVKYSAKGKELRDHLENAGVEWKEVKLLPHSLTDNEIIDRLAGGDQTQGSCFSLACAYTGNKNGLDVIDFRGGKSQEQFSRAYYSIYRFEGLDIKIEPKGGVAPAKKLLKQMEEGHEYIFTTGRHAAITRIVNGEMQYLELQSATDSGWHSLGKLNAEWYEISTSDILKWRFGCGTRAVSESSLIDIKSFKDSDEFRDLLGYLNTAADQQKKGSSGTIK